MNSNVVPVILCGGTGSRLWPVSRYAYPKQFHALVGQKSLLQQTTDRLSGISALGGCIFVTNQEYRFLVADQVQESGQDKVEILLEPCGRNSAPAVACAALRASIDADSDPVLVVMPADHVISRDDDFRERLEEAISIAKKGRLVTFGVVPNRAETGYGYIETGEPLGVDGTARIVRRFVEKPDSGAAGEYVASGNYLWNSGVFVFKAARYLEELGRHRPDILASCQQAVRDATVDMDFVRLDQMAFEECPSESIDYAVMEASDDLVVVPLDCGWDDIGAWDALAVHHAGEDGNALMGDAIAFNTTNSLLYSSSRLVAAVGLDSVVVVETPDAILVTDKDSAQDVKLIVEALKKSGRNEAIEHTKVFRPWGYYESLDIGERHQVKRISVNPGAQLSLQKHHKRAEHWVVVTGTARVTLDDNEFDLQQNESVYIPIGARHRLANHTDQEVELIEVQTGSYLGEDDIVRYEDVYGREDE
jgi:mannose-1-phosphate guanylyltransferase/mannose-6-phosphate isomerase